MREHLGKMGAVQNRGKSKSRNQDVPDPLFTRLAESEGATLDNHRVDPTLNLSMDQFDRREATNTKEAVPHVSAMKNQVSP